MTAKLNRSFSLDEGNRSIYFIVIAKPNEKRLMGRPRLGYEDNIKRELREVGVPNDN